MYSWGVVAIALETTSTIHRRNRMRRGVVQTNKTVVQISLDWTRLTIIWIIVLRDGR